MQVLIFFSTFATTFGEIKDRDALKVIFRRDGRVVDYNGLENRRTERYRGFESLSLRRQGRKLASYVIYTLYYTPKLMSWKDILYSQIV